MDAAGPDAYRRGVAFDVPAGSYERFMGRFSTPLAPSFCDATIDDLADGARVLDVGCGPGMLTRELVRRLGPGQVSAVDPSPPFVETAAARFPGTDVRPARAERLPYDDDTFDAALAQLVVHFMTDPAGGLREMARVTRPGGTVATCVWDHSGGSGPLSRFWDVAHRLDPSTLGEGHLPGTAEGELADLLDKAGLSDVRQDRLSVSVRFSDFDDWWEPYTFGVGPVGVYVRRLSPDRLERLEAALRAELPSGPFEVRADAWCATGRA